MASGGPAEVLLNVLNPEEYSLIPEDVRAKITSHFEERFEEFLTSKALFESSRTKHGKLPPTAKPIADCTLSLSVNNIYSFDCRRCCRSYLFLRI